MTVSLHRLFTGRTVTIGKKPVETMLNTLNNSMKQHGLLTRIKLTRRYEKPTKERVRKEVIVGLPRWAPVSFREGVGVRLAHPTGPTRQNELCVRLFQRGMADKHRLLSDVKSMH